MRFVLSLVFGLVIAEDSEVLKLTNDNFEQAVADHKYLLVEFCKLPFSYAHYRFVTLSSIDYTV